MDFVETTITEHIYNQGKAEGRKETAIDMLKMGIDMEIVAKVSKFSEAEIKQLAKASEEKPLPA
jgi:hypothetical protein